MLLRSICDSSVESYTRTTTSIAFHTTEVCACIVTYTRDVLDVLLCECVFVFVCCCYYARTQYIESGLVGEMTAWQCHGATNATIFPCGQTTDFLSTRRCKYCEQVQFVWKHKHKLRDLKQSEWFEWMNQFFSEMFWIRTVFNGFGRWFWVLLVVFAFIEFFSQNCSSNNEF